MSLLEREDPLRVLAAAREFCVYDGPTPESIRKVAKTNGLPVERITEVRVLEPCFHR